jgi:hypothetical protein
LARHKVLYNEKSFTPNTPVKSDDKIEIYSNTILIIGTNTNNILSIDGIKAGDTEEKLAAKFPNSTKHKSIYSNNYNDHLNNCTYFFVVTLEKNEGEVTFYIHNRIIEKIVAQFKYYAQ